MTTTSNPPEPAYPSRSPVSDRRRHRVRVVTVGGVAAVLLGGGAATAYAVGGASSTHPAASAGTSAAQTRPAPEKAPTLSAAPGLARHAPHLDGTVTSTGDGRILIKDHDGFTRTIRVSAGTVYTDGLTATPAAGTRIHAEGTVDANGTALDATRIVEPPRRPVGGPARPARPGPGTPKAGAPKAGAPKAGAPGRPAQHGHGPRTAGAPKPGPGAARPGAPARPAKPAPGTSRAGKPTSPGQATPRVP